MKYVCLNSDFDNKIVEIYVFDDNQYKNSNHPLMFASDDEQHIRDFITMVRIGYTGLGMTFLPGGYWSDL